MSKSLMAELDDAASYPPDFIVGDALKILENMPADSVDMVMTSPPYWGHRRYEVEGYWFRSNAIFVYAKHSENYL